MSSVSEAGRINLHTYAVLRAEYVCRLWMRTGFISRKVYLAQDYSEAHTMPKRQKAS